MNSIFRVCLAICLAFIACSFATAAEPEAGSYAAEVFADDPLCDYRFEDGEATGGTVARNASRAKQPGPDGVFGPAVKLVAGPSGSGRAAGFEGTGYVEIPHHAVFDADELSVEFWVRSSQPWDQKYWPGSATLISKFTYG